MRSMEYGLFFFAAANKATRGGIYDLFTDSVRFADEAGFSSVWTPERHFHEFGGYYPNPAVTGAAAAAMTSRIDIRAGSVVLPLHHPVRVAEEWSVVDNLSGGRVGVSFASGWNRNDFVLAGEPYEKRQEVFWRSIDDVRALWRGEPVTLTDASGEQHSPVLHPRPVQPDLPIWVTTGGSAETAKRAGHAGANLLTHMLGQSFEDIRELIAGYRAARAQHAGDGKVTLMLHTFVHDEAAGPALEPLKHYLRSSIGLSTDSLARLGVDVPTDELTDDDWEVLLEFAASRYLESSSLIGSLDRCRQTVELLTEIGVDEIGCLIDFGIEDSLVRRGLTLLDTLRGATA